MSATRGEHEQYFDATMFGGLPSLVVATHELKAPLALVRQLSLTLEAGNVSVDEQRHMLRQISLTSERALRLTSDLTRSVRLPDALFTLEPINPQQLCEDVIRDLTPLFTAHDREIKLTSHRRSLLLVGNRDLLQRIIMNFSDNALNYVEGDARVEIKIDTRNAGQVIRLGVRDYGPAISNDLFKSLRSKLLVSSTTPIHARPQSSGLGLYIVGQFAAAMNGNMGVTRHRDGATFYVDLLASKQLSLL